MTAEAKQPGERLKYQEGVPICWAAGCGYPLQYHDDGECPADTACPACSVEGDKADGELFRCVQEDDRCRVTTFRPGGR